MIAPIRLGFKSISESSIKLMTQMTRINKTPTKSNIYRMTAFHTLADRGTHCAPLERTHCISDRL